MFGLHSTFDALHALQQAMDRASRNDYFGISTVSSGKPSVNLFQEGNDTMVTMEIPGVKKEDIKLEVKNDSIRIQGKRENKPLENASAHRRERSNYNFDRTIKLQHEIDGNKIKAELNDGVLAILLPMKEEHKPKSITIN